VRFNRCLSDRIKVIKGELMTTTTHVDEKNNEKVPEIELDVEELEEVIAPGRRVNHNETMVRDFSE
jgi:hypothetical protein